MNWKTRFIVAVFAAAYLTSAPALANPLGTPYQIVNQRYQECVTAGQSSSSSGELHTKLDLLPCDDKNVHQKFYLVDERLNEVYPQIATNSSAINPSGISVPIRIFSALDWSAKNLEQPRIKEYIEPFTWATMAYLGVTGPDLWNLIRVDQYSNAYFKIKNTTSSQFGELSATTNGIVFSTSHPTGDVPAGRMVWRFQPTTYPAHP